MTVEEKLDTMHGDIILIKDRQATAIGKIDKHDVVIFGDGNGKKGLVTKFELLGQRVKSTSTVISTGVSGAVGIVVAVIIGIIRGK